MKIVINKNHIIEVLGEMQGKGYHIRKGDLVRVGSQFYEIENKVWESNGEISLVIVNDNYRPNEDN